MLKRILIIVIITCNFMHISAQEDFVAAGGDASSSSGSFSYSIGQVAYDNDASGLNGSINEGVQQPYEIYSMSIEDEYQSSILVNIYPNPANDYLTLELDIAQVGSVYFELFDMTGKCVLREPVLSPKYTFSLQGLRASIYILNIYMNSNKIKSYQLIKNL